MVSAPITGRWAIVDDDLVWLSDDGFTYEVNDILNPATPYNVAVGAKAALREMVSDYQCVDEASAS